MIVRIDANRYGKIMAYNAFAADIPAPGHVDIKQKRFLVVPGLLVISHAIFDCFENPASSIVDKPEPGFCVVAAFYVPINRSFPAITR